jgi:hypothetical protein
MPAMVRWMMPRYGGLLVWIVVAMIATGLAEPVACVDAAAAVPSDTDAVIVVGTLVHRRLTNDLFHIVGLWMRVEPKTRIAALVDEWSDSKISVVIEIH